MGSEILLDTKQQKRYYQIKEGLLQKINEVGNFSLPAEKINTCINAILGSIVDDNEKQTANVFFITNRGFDLLCRLIKAYYKTIKDRDEIQEFFKNLKITGKLIENFEGKYGSGGMAEIARLTQQHITKNTKFKDITLVQ